MSGASPGSSLAPTRHADGFDVFANCVLVAADDAVGFAAAIAYLADRSEVRATMGANGRAFVMERFSRERLIRDVEALYATLLESS